MGESSVRSMMDGPGAAGMPGIVPDTWLTDLLGRSAWRVVWDVPDVLSSVSRVPDDHGFFFTRVPTSEVSTLKRFEDFGFRVVDVTITFETAAAAVGSGALPNMRYAVPADRAAVAAIASTSFEWSRLHLDPAIGLETANRSRAEWASNFFDGNRGDAMIVAEHTGVPAAFLLATGPKEGTLTLDLVAVRPGVRRLGLGAACVRFAASHIAGVNGLRVSTQAANVASMRFYERLGFRVQETHYVLHLNRT